MATKKTSRRAEDGEIKKRLAELEHAHAMSRSAGEDDLREIIESPEAGNAEKASAFGMLADIAADAGDLKSAISHYGASLASSETTDMVISLAAVTAEYGILQAIAALRKLDVRHMDAPTEEFYWQSFLSVLISQGDIPQIRDALVALESRGSGVLEELVDIQTLARRFCRILEEPGSSAEQPNRELD